MEELASLKNQEEELQLQNELGKQNHFDNFKKLYEPLTDTIKDTSRDLTKTLTETSIEKKTKH